MKDGSTKSESSGEPASLDSYPGAHWHAKRRAEMLAKYPEIKKLIGPSATTLPLLVAALAVHTVIAFGADEMAGWTALLLAATAGALCNAVMFSAGHEVSHGNSSAQSPFMKALFIHLAGAIAVGRTAVYYQVLHADHHGRQGSWGFRNGLPEDVDQHNFKEQYYDKRRYGRLGRFMSIQIAICKFVFVKTAYLRAQAVYLYVSALLSRKTHPTPFRKYLESVMINNVVVGAYMGLVFYFGGVWGMTYHVLAYMFLSGFLGHPLLALYAGYHVLKAAEVHTGSITGATNWLTMGLGYHCEHHDFPKIAWSRLGRLHQIAPEYYRDTNLGSNLLTITYAYLFTEKYDASVGILIEKEETPARHAG